LVGFDLAIDALLTVSRRFFRLFNDFVFNFVSLQGVAEPMFRLDQGHHVCWSGD